MVNNPGLINKMINNINKLDDEIIKEAIQEVENEDMEEDIENIERVIDYIQLESPIIQGIGNAIYTDSLKKILKRYKELEEKETEKFLKILEDNSKTMLAKEVMELRTKAQNSIPISVIQNKIDELDRRIDYLNTELNKCYIEREKLGTETDIDNNETVIFCMEQEREYRYEQKQVLQELLEERNK